MARHRDSDHTPSGEKRVSTQTERGPFLLDGSLKVIEGAAMTPTAVSRLNRVWHRFDDPSTRTYSMRSYAQGYAGDFRSSQQRMATPWKYLRDPR